MAVAGSKTAGSPLSIGNREPAVEQGGVCYTQHTPPPLLVLGSGTSGNWEPREVFVCSSQFTRCCGNRMKPHETA